MSPQNNDPVAFEQTVCDLESEARCQRHQHLER